MDENVNQLKEGPCGTMVTTTTGVPVPTINDGPQTEDPVSTVSTTQSMEELVHGSEVSSSFYELCIHYIYNCVVDVDKEVGDLLLKLCLPHIFLLLRHDFL